MGSFWVLIFAPIRSSLSLKIRSTHPSWAGADKGYHLSALVVGFHATSYSFGIRLTAKTVDEDPASYKRWISKKRSNPQKYQEPNTRSPKTTLKRRKITISN